MISPAPIRRTVLVSASCAALSAAGVVAAPSSSAAVRPAVDCSWNPSRNSSVTANFTGTGVNIRTGPSTVCTSIGQGQPSNRVIVHCYTDTPGFSFVWLYLTDETTGKKGWSYGQFVSVFSAPAAC